MEDDARDQTLPIFPLAAVLVPGELMPLHIFEERYKALIRDALDGERRFGLSYVERAAVGADTPPEPGSVGCVAQITAVIPLPDGRMNLLAVGAGRYVVRGYDRLEPYLLARVAPLDDETPESPELLEVAAEVRALFDRLSAAARALGSEADEGGTPQLDVSPEALSFLLAANVELENDFKQELLEMTDTLARLRLLRSRVSGFVDTYEYRAEMHQRSKSNGHGRKMPDFDEDDEEE